MPSSLTQIGKYRVERELGHGAMGVVYKAFDPVVERTVAIKTVRLDVAHPEELVARLKREAKSVGQLEHPNIVTLYDAGEFNGLFFLAMQFIHGETLEDRITRQRWFTLKETYDICRQVCAGLDYAHQHGVIHRDIKPANIMLTHESVVKLTDFGIAKLVDAGTSTSGVIVGTPSYMSPEQALGKPLDGRSDIFSLGSILYELITGERAFPGQNATTVIYKIVHEMPTSIIALQPGLDPALEAMVLKALAKRPDDRFQTCGELASAIELYLSKAAAGLPSTRLEAPSDHPAAAPAPVPTPVPPAYSTPIPSAGMPSVSGTGPVPGASLLPGQARVPVAWVGGGALGVLLLVAIILLAIQLRRPPPAVTPQPTPASNPAQATQASGTPGADQQSGAPATPAAKGSLPAEVAAQGGGSSAAPSPSTSTLRSAVQASGQPAAPNPNDISPSMGRAQPSLPRSQQTKAASLPGTSAEGSHPRTEVRKPASPAPPAGPETLDSLIVKGDLAFQAGNYQNALNAYSAAYKINPQSSEARRKVALALIMLGRVDEAQKYQ